MTDRKNTSTTAGVLRPDELAKHVKLIRMDCAPSLTPWLENYWMLQWNLSPGMIYESSTLPHPACTLSVERGHLRKGINDIGGPVVVTGVLTHRFDVTLKERGWIFGVKFRPGGLASMTGISARLLRNIQVAPPTAFAPATVQALAELGPHLLPDECVTAADHALDSVKRSPEREYVSVLDVISLMLSDRSLVRVGQVQERCGIATRRLQRLFEHYVGASPKWVLARYRMHDVIRELDAGYTGSLADLATRYGWFDQAHFTREFTELIGVPPGTYQH